jgi:hypothetical protein
MTFLEFIFTEECDHLASGNYWYCPFCNPSGDRETDGGKTWASVSILPPKQRPNGSWYPIKFRCHWCGKFGDEKDLIEQLYPGISRDAVYAKIVELTHEYQRRYPHPTLGDTSRRLALSPNVKRGVNGAISKGKGEMLAEELRRKSTTKNNKRQ